eukprot:SAG31_NODE_1795_length_7248_cov_682.054833_5_plen_1228_part_00
MYKRHENRRVVIVMQGSEAATAVASGTAGGKGSGWELLASVKESHGIEVHWKAPRSIMEVKIGIGWAVAEDNLEDGESDKGFQYAVKCKSFSYRPRQSGVLEFLQPIMKRFLNKAPVVVAIWDVDLRPAKPLLWSQPFSFFSKDGVACIFPIVNAEKHEQSLLSSQVDEIAAQISSRREEIVKLRSKGRPAKQQLQELKFGLQKLEAALEAATSKMVMGSLPDKVPMPDFFAQHKRQAGIEKMNRSGFRRLMKALHEDSDPSLKVLRLKQYLDADANPMVIDAVLDALDGSTMVEALYIQNFEHGMLDAQLEHLGRVLKRGHIWALNVGENFKISSQGWTRFLADLKYTHVTHMYASEPNFGGITHDVKKKMRDVIRENRKKDGRHRSWDHVDVINQIGQMWWNPRNHIIETPVDRLLAEKPTRFRCHTCRSMLAKDHMIQCTGRGCRSVYHTECLFPPLLEEPDNWVCPKCVSTGEQSRPSKKSKVEEAANFSVIGLLVKIAEEDDDDANFQTGYVIQREPGDVEQGVPDKFLIQFVDGGQEWCQLAKLRCMIEAEMVWARQDGQPWMPGRIFRHTALCCAEHHRRKSGQEYVEMFDRPNSAPKSIWVSKESRYLKPFDPRFTTQLEENFGVGTLMVDDTLEVLYDEDKLWYAAKVIEVHEHCVKLLYTESAGWEACEDVIDLADVTPERVRRPIFWQGIALKLEAALESAKVAFQQLQERRQQLKSAVRDPAVQLREHTLDEFVPEEEQLAESHVDIGRDSQSTAFCDGSRWAQLTDKEKMAASVLGYTSIIWDSNEVPPNCCKSEWETDPEEVRCWEELTNDQQLAAGMICYTHQEWDDRMRGGVASPDNGEKSMFCKGESVYAMDNMTVAYQAKVIDIRRAAGKKNSNMDTSTFMGSTSSKRWEYEIHYQGWPSRFDEWMDSRRVFKCSRENMLMLEITDNAIAKLHAKKIDEDAELHRILSQMDGGTQLAAKWDKLRLGRQAKQDVQLPSATNCTDPTSKIRKSGKETLTQRKAREMRETWAEEERRKLETERKRRARAMQRMVRAGKNPLSDWPSERDGRTASADQSEAQLAVPAVRSSHVVTQSGHIHSNIGSLGRRKSLPPLRWLCSTQQANAVCLCAPNSDDQRKYYQWQAQVRLGPVESLPSTNEKSKVVPLAGLVARHLSVNSRKLHLQIENTERKCEPQRCAQKRAGTSDAGYNDEAIVQTKKLKFMVDFNAGAH